MQRAAAATGRPVPATTIKRGNVLVGVVSGILAATIWGAFPVVTRLGVKDTSLDYLDLTFLRVAISGLILLPLLLRSGRRGVGWWPIIIMATGIGAPYMLVVSIGLTGAPANQFAVVTPGSMICFSLFIALWWLRAPLERTAVTGIVLIVVGIVFVAIQSFYAGVGGAIDYFCFIVGGLMWATYTVAAKRYRVEAFHAATLVAVFSMLGYVPIYFYFKGLHIVSVDTTSLLIHGIYQGLFASIIALFFYNKAIAYLGSTIGATFAALIPGLSAVLEPFLLDERPSLMTVLGLAVITVGMLIAILGPNLARK